MRPHITQALPGDAQRNRLISKKRYASLFFPASVALIFMMACGPMRTLQHAPANVIFLSIKIQNQYTTAAQVTLQASFSDGGGLFALSGNQTLACDGVIFPQSNGGSTSISLNRQPPGGAYDCIYTDDQGKTSPVTVPVPQGSLAITSPAPDAVLPIPGNSQAFTPVASPTPGPRPPELTDSLTIDYTLPTLPTGAAATLRASAGCGSAASPAACGSVYGVCGLGPQGITSGICPLTDADLNYGYGFESFNPGPGSITLTSDFRWPAPVAVFQALHIEYMDTLSIPVIWVRS